MVKGEGTEERWAASSIDSQSCYSPNLKIGGVTAPSGLGMGGGGISLVLGIETGVGGRDWCWKMRLVLENHSGVVERILVLEKDTGVGKLCCCWRILLVFEKDVVMENWC